MKKVLYILIAVFTLSACSEDISEYSSQADELKNSNAQKQKEIDEKKKQLEEEKRQAEILKQRLDSLERAKDGTISDPELLSMEFRTADNPGLSKSVTCDVYSNGIVNCWLPSLADSKSLVPYFSFEGTLMMMGTTEVTSGKTRIDFSKPVTLAVTTSKGTKEYVVYVYSYTGLPVMRIDTEDGVGITSKEEYVNAHMTLTEDVKTRGAGDVLEADLQIKGRGNSTWTDWPKKPYRLKFNEKVSLLGEHKDKSWVLLSNHADKSMLRIHTAFYMGKLCDENLGYTSSSHFVDLVLNGSYDGTYEVCEKLKISNHRVAVGDKGFLLEVSKRAIEEEEPYFYVSHLTSPIQIKDPDVMHEDELYGYVRDYVTTADYILYSDQFWDPESGWKAFFDMDSFVDWYLINEITHNPDARMLYSCYMNLEPGGKLRMGPVWDFDLAFGNTDYWERGPEGFWIMYSEWFSRMFEDPAFVNRVKERYAYLYSHKADIMKEIDEAGQYLKYSAAENEKRWNVLYDYTLPNVEIWGSYLNEVQSLKVWLNNRMEWLRAEFENM